jgi:sulfonate transport system permease protein
VSTAQATAGAVSSPGTFAAARASRSWATPASIVGMLVLWHVVSALAGENKSGDALVPNIIDIAGSVKRFADYWKGGLGVEATKTGGAVTAQGVLLGFAYNVGLTTLRLVVGVLLGIALGVGAAVLISWSSLLRGLFGLLGHFARMLPLLAMVPLFSLWFGDTEHGAVLFIAFTSFSLLFVIALNAIGNVAPYCEQYARSLGASRAQAYFRVVLPAAFPEIRSGLLLAVGFGWSAAIASEYLGQEYGLGHIVQNAEYFGRTDLLALVAFIALVAAALSLWATGRFLSWATRWAE